MSSFNRHQRFDELRERNGHKLQYAQFLAASLAYLLNRQQDSVGLVAFDEKVHTHVPARNRTGHMRTIFGHLSRLEAGGQTKLNESLHQLAEILTRRGIVVVISDFYDEPERLKEAFQHLRFKGHDLVAFHVLDQNEMDFILMILCCCWKTPKRRSRCRYFRTW